MYVFLSEYTVGVFFLKTRISLNKSNLLADSHTSLRLRQPGGNKQDIFRRHEKADAAKKLADYCLVCF